MAMSELKLVALERSTIVHGRDRHALAGGAEPDR